ncbi:hypothetical protein [Rickettsiales endosymbiont of Stachyamoeba lipophora]|uniref:hypothetical protein n=1 Tax=Rickettsiales endosymbiont of Stachyamoeba lipophora TaxID=2486578 RepID=UPI000F6456E4|nr:hypothetical protein [Rickettsiales endosymbiont of Stachyamoeba lipophora]AZL15708.1 hypothetical protein EF513_03980 [Rickettsiales endosymbiont of Stachyamoeba lipophora]
MSDSDLDVRVDKVVQHLGNIPADLKLPFLKHLKKLITKVADKGAEGFDKLTDILNVHLSKTMPEMKFIIDQAEKVIDSAVMTGIKKGGETAVSILDKIDHTDEHHTEITQDHA